MDEKAKGAASSPTPKLYDPNQFVQNAPLGDIGRIESSGIVELSPGLIAMSGWLSELVSRIRASRGLDPRTGEIPRSLQADVNTPLEDQPSLPAYPDVTASELCEAVCSAVTAHAVRGEDSLQTVCGAPVYVGQAMSKFAVAPLPVDASEAALPLSGIWAARAKAAHEAAHKETTPAGRDAPKAPTPMKERKAPAKWPTVRFPVGAVKPRVGRDGRPVPAMSLGRQMVVSAGRHRGEPMFSGFAVMPAGTTVSGQDLGGYRIHHLLKRSDLESIEKGRGVVLQFNPAKPVRLLNGFGDSMKSVTVDDASDLARAIREARDTLEGGGRARPSAGRDEHGPTKAAPDKSARRGWAGVLFPKGHVTIVRDEAGDPAPAMSGASELKVKGGPHAGESLYRVEVRMPEGSSVRGLDVSGMSFEANMREAMLPQVGSSRGTYVSLNPSQPIILRPPQGDGRGKVTVDDPFEVVDSVRSATSKSGPVRVIRPKARVGWGRSTYWDAPKPPCNPFAPAPIPQGPRRGPSPKLDEMPGAKAERTSEARPPLPHRVVTRS